MGSSRDNLIKIIRRYIAEEEITVKEMADMIKRSARHVQKCLSCDLTGEHAEFDATEIVTLARYFSGVGRNELAGQFLCENYKITSNRFGHATGSMEPHVKKLHEIGVDLARAYINNDTSEISRLETELAETQVNIAAERAVMVEKQESDFRRMIE